MIQKDFSDSEFALALARNFRALTRGKKPSSSPHAIILGGQSGAGKTVIHRVQQVAYEGNIIVIDGDSFRAQHPHFAQLQKEYGPKSVDYTKRFAGRMVEKLIEQLSDSSYHLLIEGTLRTTEVPQQTAQRLKEKGYQLELDLIATKPLLSYLSTLIRYEELYARSPSQARGTAKQHHDYIVHHLIENTRQLEKLHLFDRIQIYRRDRSCVYDSQNNLSAVQDRLEKVLFGPWTEVEKEMLTDSMARLQCLSEKNNHQDLYVRLFEKNYKTLDPLIEKLQEELFY